MTPRQRWLLLGGLLVATVAAAWVEMDGGDRPAVSARDRPPSRIAAPVESRAATIPGLRLDKMKARNPGESVRDPFAENSRPAPRSRDRDRASRRPVAPPQPFVFAGRMVESDGATAVFLTNGERNLVVRQGDIIDDTWRVEQVAPDGITLLYLPLRERQVIAASENSQ